MRRTSDERGYVGETGLSRETGQARERRVQTITGASVPTEGGPTLNVAQLHQETLFSLDDRPQAGMSPNSGSSGLSVPADGAPQLLTPSVWVMPPGWTTTPPQSRTVTAELDQPSDDDLDLASLVGLYKSITEGNPVKSAPDVLMQNTLARDWNDRQTRIANWKNATWSAALPSEVMRLILDKAFEAFDPDDMRPELAFIRNLGAVCKGLAVTIDALRRHQGTGPSVLRRAAAAYESKLLDKFCAFEMEFKESFLCKRWGFQAAWENRPGMTRFEEFLHSDASTQGVYWSHRDEYSASTYHERLFGKGGFVPMDAYTFTLRTFTSQLSRATFIDFVKQHGDQITNLSIGSDIARDGELVEQLRHCRKLTCLKVFGGEVADIDFNWLANLPELNTLDLCFCTNPRIPASQLARLRKLVVASETLRSWEIAGVRPSNWTAMKVLDIYGDMYDELSFELPPNLERFKTRVWPDVTTFPLGLTALNLTAFKKSRMLMSKISKLDALTKLKFLPHSDEDAPGFDLNDAMAIADFLKSGRHRLRVLILNLEDNLQVTNVVLSALETFDSLEALSLGEIPRDTQVIEALARIITRQTHLRKLKLHFTSLYHPTTDHRRYAPFQLAVAESASLRRVELSFRRDGNGKGNQDGFNIAREMGTLLEKNRNLLEMRVLPTSGSWRDVDLRRNWRLRPEPKPPGTSNA
ncbi:MAG: hypothetical protein JWR21_2708 [Herminiimonas sp.]|nr:hypothetical protein [Herminiimonas sp.]